MQREREREHVAKEPRLAQRLPARTEGALQRGGQEERRARALTTLRCLTLMATAASMTVRDWEATLPCRASGGASRKICGPAQASPRIHQPASAPASAQQGRRGPGGREGKDARASSSAPRAEVRGDEGGEGAHLGLDGDGQAAPGARVDGAPAAAPQHRVNRHLPRCRRAQGVAKEEASTQLWEAGLGQRKR